MLIFYKIRDRQLSISLGKPMTISDYDCDIEMIKEDDLRLEFGNWSPLVLILNMTYQYVSLAGIPPFL